jgi:antitoxin (DNA-binding transcriptional repressor) of toxin-antitoxin stability system
MRKVGIKALKNDLSKYIRAAAAGETVLVTDRGQVVAEIAPPQAAAGGELMSNARLAEDVRRGWITPAADASYAPGPKVHVAPFDEIMRELRADRDRR